MKNLAKIGILVLAIAALIYVIYRIGAGQILQVLPRALKPELVLILALYYIAYTLRGIRWSWLIMRKLSLWEGFRLIYLNNFFNFVSPVRVGELWRIKECRKYGIGVATAATIVERVLDVITVILLTIISLTVVGMNMQAQLNQGLLASAIMIIVALIALKILQDKRVWQLASKFISVDHSEHVSVRNLLKERNVLGKSFTLTIIIWILAVVLFWLMANLIAPVSLPFAGVTLLVSTLLGSTLITSVGVAHILLIIGILSLQVNYVDAAAIGILMGIVYYWLQIILGYVVYLKT